jgi:hypothetical protein
MGEYRNERWKGVVATAVAVATLLPALSWAQAAARGVPRETREAAATRYQVRVMEGVLESAVQHGAQVVTAQIRRLSPDFVAFTGPARARGYRLESYGMFFSVDVPAVRRSIVWSVRTLHQSGLDMSRALESLRRAVEAQSDARAKHEMEQALRLVELQVGPVSREDATPAVTGAAGGQAAREGPREEASAVVQDPGAAYESEVKSALTDAMLDYGPPLAIAPDEWLTVAARDNEDRLGAGELADTVTITLRLRGRDLAAFRAGQITRDEARARVEVREF